MTTPVTFLKETRDELSKVTWPLRTEVIRLTFAVIVVSLLVAAFIGGLDFAFTKGLQAVITQANNARVTTNSKTIQIQQPTKAPAKGATPSKTGKPTTQKNSKGGVPITPNP